MLNKVRTRMTYANVVASVAMFIALGGGAYATHGHKLTAKDIAKGAVTPPKIKKAAVKPAKLANGAVRPAKLAPGAVTKTKIADGAVDSSRIADGAVDGNKIADGAVAERTLAPEVTDLLGSGPEAYYTALGTGPDWIQESPAYTYVLGRQVPAGLYAVQAKVLVSNQGQGHTTVRCRVRAGGSSGSTTVDDYSMPIPAGLGEAMPFQAVVSLAESSNSIWIECRRSNAVPVAIGESPRLTAVRLGEPD